MFEGILASILNKYLSQYIDEVDYNNLKIGLFSGTLELSDIKIKKSALYQFDLPIEVKCGKIGKLRINISWKNIMTKPAVAEIEDLFVLLGPFEDNINDPKRIEEIVQAYKRKVLQEFEKIDKAEIYENKEKGFAEKVQDTIINNIQVYVRNVHIRYEDKFAIKNKIISCGLYLSEFRAETVDANGNPNFLNANEKIIYKQGSLNEFNLYWNSSPNVNSGSADSLITVRPEFKTDKNFAWKLLKDSIRSGNLLNTTFNTFMEKNLSLSTTLTLRRSLKKEEMHLPKITFQSSVSAIEFIFMRSQYKSILEIIDHYTLLNIHKKYVKYRPKEALKDKPSAWWKYAFTSQAETTWRSYRRDRMLAHWKNYKSYLKLYERKVELARKNKELDAKEKKSLELLEDALLLQSIIDARNLVQEKFKPSDIKVLVVGQSPDKPLKRDFGDRPLDYVEFRLMLYFPLISLRLRNSGHDILKINFRNIATRFELRPIADSVYFLINTRGIDLFGIYYKDSISSSTNTLVPIVKSLTSGANHENEERLWLRSSDLDSKLLVNEEDQDVLFMFCFESNPINIENVESSIRVRFSQAEIFYEKTAITELLRFFKTDLIDFVEVKKIREVWTKAGVIYAVENHKQIHVSAELASPYFILPMKGTCTEPGNSIVFFLGKTHIESQVQAKLTNYTPSSIKDLDEHFYDKLKLTVNDVQIILVPTGVDWKSYLNDCESRDYKYHILYPVTTENTVFFSINPSYKKLPKLKLNAVCSSIRLNFSDNKILKIYDFSQKFPLPEVPKVGGPASSTTTSPAGSTATSTRSSMLSPTTPTVPKRQTMLDDSKIKLPKNASSASIVEPDDEWDGPFMLPVDINGDPIPNYCQLLFNLNVKKFGINLNSTNEHLKEDDPAEETKYLDFALNEIRIDFAITKYGLNFRAGLGDLKLIDKIHANQGRAETEILSSLSSTNSSGFAPQDLIRFYFRKVEENAPNFATLYSKILSNVMFDCSNIQVACHRSVIVYFLNYAKRITDNLIVDRKSTSSDDGAGSGSNINATIAQQALVDDKSRDSKQPVSSADVCEFNVIARMNQLKWDMYDTSLTFGNMTVNNLSINFNIRGLRTELGVQLRTILINYTDVDSVINDAYEQIVQCVGDRTSDQFFDFSMILYGEDKTKKVVVQEDKRKRTARIDENEELTVSVLNSDVNRPATLASMPQQDSIRLRVGRIKIICLVKFFNELVNFMEPIVNPLPSNLTEQVKDQAIEAVKNAYQDVEQTEKIILLDIQVTSPQVVIPQNSGSLSGFLVDLGHLKITNSIRNVPVASSDTAPGDSILRRNLKFSVIDDISLSLQSVEVKRILYEKTGADFFKIKEQVVDPVNLTARIQRTVKNLDKQSIPDIEISAVIVNLDSRISLKTARLLFAILNENLNEGLQQTPALEEKKSPAAATTTSVTNQNKPGTSKLPNILEEEDEKENGVKSNRVSMKINLELKKIRVSVVESARTATSSSTKSDAGNTSGNVSNLTTSPTNQSLDLANSSINNSNNSANFSSKFVNFSLLQIEDIQVDFSSRENKSWLANLKLKALSVFDTRPDSNLAVKEMIIPSDSDKYFIEMVYSSEPGVLDHLTFVLDHIRINLCLPYILKLYSMATDAVSSPATTSATAEAATKAVKPVSNAGRKSIINETEESKTSEETSRNKMSVVGKVRLPDVVLFAQPEKQDSKILNVSADIHVAFNSDKGSTSLEINLVELSIRLGEFNNSKRQGIPFLAPCSAIITMSQSSSKEIARYFAIIDALYFNMTPTLYEVVMGVIGTLNNAGTESKAKQKETKKRLEESDPFVLYDVDPDIQHAVGTNDPHNETTTATDRTINEMTVDEHTRAVVVKEDPKSKTKLLEILELTIKEAYITFCEESGVDLQPLAIVRLELNGRVSNWTRNLHTKASLCLEASYYNDNLSNWEPLIENVMQKEDLYRPWILRIWFAIDSGHALRPPDDNIGIQDTEFSVADLDYSPIDGDDDAENENRKNDGQPRLFGRMPTLKLTRRKKSVKPGGGEDTDDEEDDDDNLGDEYNQESMDEKYKASHILVESNDLLNINLTPSAYKVLMYLTSITGGSADKEFVESKAKPLLKFMNFIGEKGHLVLSSELFLKPEHAVGFDLKFADPSSIDILPTSSSTSLFGKNFDLEQGADEIMQDRVHDIALNSQRSQIDNAYNEAYKFELSLKGFEPVRLSMKNDGSFLFQLRTLPRELQSPSLEPLLLNQEDGDDNNDQIETSFYSSTFKYNAMFKVRTLYGRTKVIFSSPLQIENYSPLRLLIMVELTEQNRSKLHILEEVHSDTKSYAVIFYLVPGKVFYVPLYVAYNCKLYTAPEQLKQTPGLIFDVRGYNLRLNDINEINFTSATNSKLVEFQLIRTLNINVRSHRNVMPSMHANYLVALYSPMRILNCLPFPIRLDMTDSEEVKLALDPGEVLNTHLRRSNSTLCKLNVINYLNVSWAGLVDWNELIKDDATAEVIKLELDVPPTNELTIKGKHLTIYISYKKPNEFMFFSPYWLVNKSGQHIQIRACDTLRHFEVPDDSILLFDYKTINKDNKVRMCINNGMWSEPFSLETVGTTGMIQCKDERRTYNFLMRITMSNSSRAKLITFAPFLSIVNELDQSMLIREWQYHERFVDKKEWKSIEPIVQTNRPTSYWPNNAGESKQVCFVLRTTDGFETQPFPLENPGRFVLPLKQNRTAQKSESKTSNLNDPTSNPLLNGSAPPPALRIVTVLISGGSQNPVTIIIRKYVYGDAVAKLVNLCPYTNITIKPKYVDSGWTLEPMKSMFFVWPELIKSTRELTWSVNSSSARHVESLNLANSGKTECVFKGVEIKLPPSSSSFNTSDDTSHNLNDTNNLLPPNRNSNQHMNGSNQGVSSIRRDLTIYCVSYIDGSQRVIVFTTDSSLAEIERKKEASNMEIFVALKGILISVVNNSNLEIACISLKDSRPLWSLINPVTNGTKMFTNEYSEWLEKVYNLYLLNSNRTFRKYIKKSVHIPGAEGIEDDPNASETKQQRRMAGNKFDIDFKNMRMYKPEKGHLKRIWQPGLSVQYLVSSNMMSLKCCIFNLQIDNQLPDAYFPISFHKAPKRMDDEKPFVPFLTLSLFTEQQEVLQIYRCFDCLFQEFFLKLDKGFLFSMKSWYDSATEETSIDDRAFDLSDENSKEAINLYFNLEPDKVTLQKMSNDLKLAKEIMEYANQSGSVKQSAHIRFDDFYISPIQFNLSFSVNGTPHTDGKDLQLGGAEMVFNFFLESIGATVTEFKDVRFRFNQFDLNNVTKTWKEIYDEIFDHYKIQTLHQAYALILGLDVLGNPYGLVTDFSQGLTDLFFDPLLGVFSKSKKKRDFKMRKRIKATVNKTISSAAGSGSLISGSVGRVLAAISLDKEYKQKRQYKLSKLPYKSIPETLLIAGKGVVAGTVYGVAGVVKKPIEEKKNGSGGVAAGVGKGLLGLFAKPVGSVFDGISISLDGLKRFAQAGLETVINTRLPRHLIHEVAILPYSEYQAQGYEILRDLQNDNMALNENYWAHMFYGFKKNATLIFITDCNIYRLKKTRTQIFAKWYVHDPPVPLHKIKQVKVMNLTPEEKNSGLFSTILQGKVPDEAQKIYVTFMDQPNIDQLRDDQKIMLLTSTPEVIGWLKDKISSVIKYYKELKRAGEML